jgi:hypothetical protein
MNKLNLIFLGVICLVIFVAGMFAFNTIVADISGPTASQQMNTTMSMGNTVYGITGILLLVIAVCMILGFLFYWVSTPERYKKPNKIIKFLYDSLYYFGYGCAGLVIVAIPTYMIYFMYTYTVVDGNIEGLIFFGQWILICIAGFFAIAGFGYVFKKKFVDKLLLRLKEGEYESNMEELPKVN